MRRAQLIAIGLVLAVALLIGVVSLGQAKPRMTGNNGVAPDVFLATITPTSGPLCVNGVSVPAGTVGVRLMIGTYQRDGASATMVTRSSKGEELGRPDRVTFDDGSHVIFDLPAGARDGMTLCWKSPEGRLAIPGRTNGNTNIEQTSVLGDRPVGGDISLEYVRAGKHSALSMVPTIFARASLFRPSWVGSWTYYLVFLVAALMVLAAVALLVHGGRSNTPITRQLMLAIAAVAFVNAALWALVTPAFNAPDEFSHFTYSETLASGQLPDRNLKPGDPGNSYLPSSVYASDTTATPIIQNKYVKEPWTKQAERQFESHYRALVAGPDVRFGMTPANVYTPLYYGPSAIAYKLGGGNIFDRLFLMRLWSALLFALGVVFAILFVREMLPTVSWAPYVAGLAVAFEPMAAHLGGAVTNDSMMVAACAAALWFGARLLRRGVSFWDAFGAMVAAVVAYAAKPTGLGIAPAIGLVLLIALIRADSRAKALRTMLLAALIPVVALGSLYLLFGAGGDATNIAPGVDPLRPVTLTGFLSYIWQWYLPSIGSMDEYWVGVPPAFRVFFGGFLADFNSLDTNFPDGFYKVAVVAATLMLALTVRAVWDRRARLRTQWPFVIYPAVAVAGTALLIHATGYLLWTQDAQVFAQGRYFFPVLAVFGLYIVTSGIGSGRRLGLAVASAAAVALACTNVAGMMLSLGRFYL